MMFNPKYIVILTGLFCSVVAVGISHLFFFFRKYFGKGWFFEMTTLAFGLASQAQAKNYCYVNEWEVDLSTDYQIYRKSVSKDFP